MPIVECENCKKIFIKKTEQIKKTKKNFCSRNCFYKYIRKNGKYSEPPKKKYNELIEQDEYFILKVYSKKLGEHNILIDKEDYKKVSVVKWSVIKNCHTYYAVAKINKKSVRLHRLILDFPKNKSIDHINHNGLDNRKQNLRICTHLENMQNKKVPKNNKIGISGIYYNSKLDLYIVRKQYNNMRDYIGSFKSLNKAKTALQKYLKEKTNE